MTPVVVTGASGFIGRYLVEALVARGRQVRALTRRAPEHGVPNSNVQWVVGDIADEAVWSELLIPGCTVVNLAHSQVVELSDALDATDQMLGACAKSKIQRLVHCSTVSVYGRSKKTDLSEDSACNPLNAYGRTKLAIEQRLKLRSHGRFSLAILRPTVVFGPGGDALVKLVDGHVNGSRAANYLRSSLFGHRRTNLVPVETVAAALVFLIDTSFETVVETFIVSDDDDPLNNFFDVEKVLMGELGIPSYRLPPIPVPRKVLETVMRLRGRVNVDTLTRYRSDKLREWGFVRPVSLKDALVQYSAQFERARGLTVSR